MWAFDFSSFFLRNCHRRCYGLYLHLFCTWSSGFRFAMVGVQGELSRIGTSRITFSERNTLSARFFTRRPGGVPQGLRFVQEGKRSRYLNHSIALLAHLFFLEQLAHVSTRTQGNVSLTAQAISPFPQHKTRKRLESPPPPPSPSVQRKRGRISRPREPGQRGDTVRRGADAN